MSGEEASGRDEAELEKALASAHRALDADEPERAKKILDRGLKAAPRAAAVARAEALSLLATAHGALDDLAAARASFQEAQALIDPPTSDEARGVLAGLLEDFAELELHGQGAGSARTMLERAVALYEELGEPVDAETWLALAEARSRSGAHEAALEAADHALESARSGEDPEAIAVAIEIRSEVLVELEDGARTAEAETGFAQALAAWRELDADDACARCLLSLAKLAELRDDAARVKELVAAIEALPASEERDEALEEARSLG